MGRMTVSKARGIQANLRERASNPDSVLGGWADSGPAVYAAKRAEVVAHATRELERCTAWIERQERQEAKQVEAKLAALCATCYTHHAGECY